MTVKSFEELDIWKRGARLAVELYNLCKTEDVHFDWGLKDQLRRASVSIPSNIAEGFARGSNPEFLRFLGIAKGSCAELKTQLYIAEGAKLIASSTSRPLIKECGEIAAMIGALEAHIKKVSPKKSRKSPLLSN